jgi:hypothetical protein
MLGSVARRERLPLWALLSFVAVLGFAVSALLAEAARNAALDGVVDRARDAGRLLTDTVPDKQLADPIKGETYDKLANRISRSVSAEGSSVAVTVWSWRGLVLFALDQPSVGTSDREMRPLIADMSDGSGSYRVEGTTVRAFLPVPRLAKDQVVLVEVDEPLSVVEARVGGVWTFLRMAFAFGLAVSLLLLGLSFASSLRRSAAPEDEERPADRAPQQEDDAKAKAEAAGSEVDQRVTEPATSEPSETAASETAPSEPEPSEPEPRPSRRAAKRRSVTERPTASFTEALEALQALQPDLEHAIHPAGVARETAAHEDEDPREEAAAAVDQGAYDAAAKGGEAHAAVALDDLRDDAARTDDEPDGEPAMQELMRKRREEFKARAAKAELRVKQQAELQQTGSGPGSEQ